MTKAFSLEDTRIFTDYLSAFTKFSDSFIFWEVFTSKRKKMLFGKISTYTCIQALKCRMQAVFLMQIKNFKSDCQDFDFLRFLGINSEFNHIWNRTKSEIIMFQSKDVRIFYPGNMSKTRKKSTTSLKKWFEKIQTSIQTGPTFLS